MENGINALYNKILKDPNIINKIKLIADKYNYPIFKRNDKYPINLNIWGIRSNNHNTKYYNDVIIFFYELAIGAWYKIIAEATTDPSDLNLKTPINNKGCAILKEGFHKGLWKVGKHKNQYTALVQANPCYVYRDNNKDDIIDYMSFDNKDIDYGMFGINLHRASSWQVKDEIGLYSAGCQVIKDVNLFNDPIIPLVTKAIGNGTQSYVLINEMNLD